MHQSNKHSEYHRTERLWLDISHSPELNPIEQFWQEQVKAKEAAKRRIFIIWNRRTSY